MSGHTWSHCKLDSPKGEMKAFECFPHVQVNHYLGEHEKLTFFEEFLP
jgi:hypothetical protein